MFNDIVKILVWWFAFFGLGILFLPLTRKIFHSFFDQGYFFAKVVAILYSSYLVWLLASLKILPFTQETIVLILFFGLIINVVVFLKNKKGPFPIKIWLLEELMFLLTLVFWSYIRGLQPDIQGLEKFMDFGFVNSILKSNFFPPADMWFAGKSINYYYFGHFITAFLTKLTSIDSAVTYNLVMATLFAFTFSLTFSLTGNFIYLFIKEKFDNSTIRKFDNLKLVIFGGLISAFLISLGANFHPAFYNFKMSVLKQPYCDGATTYWYPNATRYIGYCPNVDDKTIHEFPSYSFIVSDLHGHVSDIPFVLLFLAMTFNLLISLRQEKNKTFNFSLLTFNLPISLILAVMYMTNQWDFPIYLMVLGFTLLAGYYQHYGATLDTLKKAVVFGLIIIILSIPLILPFQFHFENLTKGIGLVRTHSLPHQLLILWGVPWFFGSTFLFFLFGYKIKPKQLFKKENLVQWFSKLLGVRIKFERPSASSQLDNLKIGNLFSTDLFVLILFFVSTILIIVPEIIYLKDIYIPSYHRANTMFKLTYQSFIMFSLCIGYIIVRIYLSLKKTLTRKLIFTFYILLFACLMVYPFYSIPGYYGSLKLTNYKGLYGLKFLERLYPDDYRLVNWLNKNVSGQPVVLEAVGDSYTDYERISMATGLPTIEGWLVHEWLWRGSFDEPGKRSSEVQSIYESNDLKLTKDLLDKYQVKFVVIGNMEREKYQNINEQKFNSLGKKVFESGETKIFELL